MDSDWLAQKISDSFLKIDHKFGSSVSRISSCSALKTERNTLVVRYLIYAVFRNVKSCLLVFHLFAALVAGHIPGYKKLFVRWQVVLNS